MHVPIGRITREAAPLDALTEAGVDAVGVPVGDVALLGHADQAVADLAGVAGGVVDARLPVRAALQGHALLAEAAVVVERALDTVAGHTCVLPVAGGVARAGALTDVAHAVVVDVGLIGVVGVGAVVDVVVGAVPVAVVVADVADAIAVLVGLIGVREGRAVVADVAHAVAVAVGLVGVGVDRAVVCRVVGAVTVGVGHERVGALRHLVDVGDPIVVVIVVARVAPLVIVGVGLIGVGDRRAVVGVVTGVDDAVAVDVAEAPAVDAQPQRAAVVGALAAAGALHPTAGDVVAEQVARAPAVALRRFGITCRADHPAGAGLVDVDALLTARVAIAVGVAVAQHAEPAVADVAPRVAEAIRVAGALRAVRRPADIAEAARLTVGVVGAGSAAPVAVADVAVGVGLTGVRAVVARLAHRVRAGGAAHRRVRRRITAPVARRITRSAVPHRGVARRRVGGAGRVGRIGALEVALAAPAHPARRADRGRRAIHARVGVGEARRAVARRVVAVAPGRVVGPRAVEAARVADARRAHPAITDVAVGVAGAVGVAAARGADAPDADLALTAIGTVTGVAAGSAQPIGEALPRRAQRVVDRPREVTRPAGPINRQIAIRVEQQAARARALRVDARRGVGRRVARAALALDARLTVRPRVAAITGAQRVAGRGVAGHAARVAGPAHAGPAGTVGVGAADPDVVDRRAARAVVLDAGLPAEAQRVAVEAVVAGVALDAHRRPAAGHTRALLAVAVDTLEVALAGLTREHTGGGGLLTREAVLHPDARPVAVDPVLGRIAHLTRAAGALRLPRARRVEALRVGGAGPTDEGVGVADRLGVGRGDRTADTRAVGVALDARPAAIDAHHALRAARVTHAAGVLTRRALAALADVAERVTHAVGVDVTHSTAPVAARIAHRVSEAVHVGRAPPAPPRHAAVARRVREALGVALAGVADRVAAVDLADRPDLPTGRVLHAAPVVVDVAPATLPPIAHRAPRDPERGALEVGLTRRAAAGRLVTHRRRRVGGAGDPRAIDHVEVAALRTQRGRDLGVAVDPRDVTGAGLRVARITRPTHVAIADIAGRVPEARVVVAAAARAAPSVADVAGGVTRALTVAGARHADRRILRDIAAVAIRVSGAVGCLGARPADARHAAVAVGVPRAVDVRVARAAAPVGEALLRAGALRVAVAAPAGEVLADRRVGPAPQVGRRALVGDLVLGRITRPAGAAAADQIDARRPARRLTAVVVVAAHHARARPDARIAERPLAAAGCRVAAHAGAADRVGPAIDRAPVGGVEVAAHATAHAVLNGRHPVDELLLPVAVLVDRPALVVAAQVLVERRRLQHHPTRAVVGVDPLQGRVVAVGVVLTLPTAEVDPLVDHADAPQHGVDRRVDQPREGGAVGRAIGADPAGAARERVVVADRQRVAAADVTRRHTRPAVAVRAGPFLPVFGQRTLPPVAARRADPAVGRGPADGRRARIGLAEPLGGVLPLLAAEVGRRARAVVGITAGVADHARHAALPRHPAGDDPVDAPAPVVAVLELAGIGRAAVEVTAARLAGEPVAAGRLAHLRVGAVVAVGVVQPAADVVVGALPVGRLARVAQPRDAVRPRRIEIHAVGVAERQLADPGVGADLAGHAALHAARRRRIALAEARVRVRITRIARATLAFAADAL